MANKNEQSVSGPLLAPLPLNQGAGHSVLVKLGEWWNELHHFRLSLVTTATVGNRTLSFSIADAQNRSLWAWPLAAAVAAGTTANYYAAKGVVGVTMPANAFLLPLPIGLWLPPNSVLTVTDTAAIDATDTLAGQLVYDLASF